MLTCGNFSDTSHFKFQKLNKQKYHRREVELADTTLEVHAKLGYPSYRDFLYILTSNQLRNCPITVEDARRAFKIYGPDVATLKGKTVKKKNHPAPTLVTTSLPPFILDNHGDVTLCIDFFFSLLPHDFQKNKFLDCFKSRQSLQVYNAS